MRFPGSPRLRPEESSRVEVSCTEGGFRVPPARQAVHTRVDWIGQPTRPSRPSDDMSRPSLPWTRLLVEGVVIVGSILLAFALDSGWDRLQEREWERSQLATLRLELEENLTQAETSIEIHTSLERQMDQLREWSLAGPAGHREALPAGSVSSLLAWRTTEFSLGALDALVTSGDLGRIRSADIRRALTMWRRQLLDTLEKETLALEFAEMVLMPALAGQGFVGEASLSRPPFWSPAEGDLVTVQASVELSDLLAARIAHERMAVRDLEELAEETRRMLELVDAELGR